MKLNFLDSELNRTIIENNPINPILFENNMSNDLFDQSHSDKSVILRSIIEKDDSNNESVIDKILRFATELDVFDGIAHTVNDQVTNEVMSEPLIQLI